MNKESGKMWAAVTVHMVVKTKDGYTRVYLSKFDHWGDADEYNAKKKNSGYSGNKSVLSERRFYFVSNMGEESYKIDSVDTTTNFRHFLCIKGVDVNINDGDVVIFPGSESESEESKTIKSN